MSQHGWQVQNPWGLAGAVAGGSVSGVVGGLAGPAGGTIAKEFGQVANGGLARVADAVISGVGSSGGSLVDDIVSGRPVDGRSAALSGVFGVGGTAVEQRIGVGMKGVDTVKQMPVAHPRSWEGAFDLTRRNTAGLWGSAGIGGAVGGMSDQLQNEVEILMGWR